MHFKSILSTLAFLCVAFSGAFAQEDAQNGETEDFRRSSLCLMVVTHQGDQYAKALQEQFLAMPLPSRYNNLNVDVRVINTPKKFLSKKKVGQILADRQIAKELVGKWFNRDGSGKMNMERIHEWGGYNATYSDLKRAQSTERGTAILTDEGTELLKNTFVMVCDLTYYDRQATGELLQAFSQAVGYVAGSLTNDATTKKNYNDIGNALAQTASDIAGFSVKVKAHLYRMEWSNKLRDKVFTQYWIDNNTSSTDAENRKAAFDNDHKSFKLDYLGTYYSRAGRTVSKSSSNLEYVICQVCEDATNNSINNLAKMFPVFKPKTPFYCDGDNVYAYIGTKEGVGNKSKFDVIETERTKKGIEYDEVGVVRPTNIWNNTGMNITQDSLELKYKGTQFTRYSGRKDICNQGLLLRERGKLGYQFSKKNFWYGSITIGETMLSDKAAKKVADQKLNRNVNKDDLELSTMAFGYNFGWAINYKTNFAWNVFNIGMFFGDNGKKNGDYDQQTVSELTVGTGIILRTNPNKKHGNFSWFIWPMVGVGYYSVNPSDGYHNISSYNGLNVAWNIKMGVTLTERLFIDVEATDYHIGFNVGYFF